MYIVYSITVVMSSLCSNTVLPSRLMAIWSTADIQSAENLGALLAARRDDLDGTPDEIQQFDIADAVGFSQSYISKIERGQAERRIPLWPSGKQLALLRAYKFTDNEILEIVDKFGLDINPSSLRFSKGDRKNSLVMPLSNIGNLDEIRIKSLGNPDEDGYDLPHTLLGQHRPDDCFTIAAKGGILASDEVRRAFPEGLRLFFDESITPHNGDTVAYRVVGEERFVITTYQEPPPPRALKSYDGTDVLTTRADKPELELLGVLWWYWPPQGRTSELKITQSV